MSLWKRLKEGVATIVRKVRTIELRFVERRAKRLRKVVTLPVRKVFKRAEGKSRKEALLILNQAVDEGEITREELDEGTPQL